MKFKLDFGSEVDLLTAGEVLDVLMKRDVEQRARLAGVKYRRMVLTGQAVGGALDIGGDSKAGWNGQPVGPLEGSAWAFRRIAVAGLTPSSTTPDVVNIYRYGSGSGALVWQLNGNVFTSTFSFGEMVFLPGEKLRVASLGTFAATGQIVVSGDLVQVPSERISEYI